MLRKILLTFGFLAASSANAAVVVNIYQDGGDVVSTYSGTIDLAGITFYTTGFPSGVDELRPGYPAYYRLDGIYGAFNAAQSGDIWGTGTGLRPASSSTGDLFGFRNDSLAVVYLDRNYTSGDAITGGMSFFGQTLASLGLVEGVYNDLLTWGSGGNADSISLIISQSAPSAVPLPAGFGLLAAAMGALGLSRRRRRKS